MSDEKPKEPRREHYCAHYSCRLTKAPAKHAMDPAPDCALICGPCIYNVKEPNLAPDWMCKKYNTSCHKIGIKYMLEHDCYIVSNGKLCESCPFRTTRQEVFKSRYGMNLTHEATVVAPSR